MSIELNRTYLYLNPAESGANKSGGFEVKKRCVFFFNHTQPMLKWACTEVKFK